jgi:hypothetical protein
MLTKGDGRGEGSPSYPSRREGRRRKRPILSFQEGREEEKEAHPILPKGKGKGELGLHNWKIFWATFSLSSSSCLSPSGFCAKRTNEVQDGAFLGKIERAFLEHEQQQ